MVFCRSPDGRLSGAAFSVADATDEGLVDLHDPGEPVGVGGR
jgi:hypothetical protein